MFSLLIPVYNEEGAITQTIHAVHEALHASMEEYEIMVIDDGSTDGTAAELAKLKVQFPKTLTILTNPENHGYGASVKRGIRHARGDILGLTDADGTYPVARFPDLLAIMREKNADMVVGARTLRGAKIPWNRRPAKAMVALLANILTGRRIPDNNSGMRVFRKSMAEQFMHLYPKGFSFTLTITLAAITSDYLVEFVPIEYYKRTGKSSLSKGFNGLRNFAAFLGLIIRIVTYFRPLKFFVWPSALLIGGGILTAAFTLWQEANVSDAGLLLIVTGLQTGFFGLLADIIVRQARREH